MYAEWLQDKGIIRSFAPLPNASIHTLDGENPLPPQRDPSPPVPASIHQPKAEPDVDTPSLTDPGMIERDPDHTDTRGSSGMPLGILGPGPGPDAGPSLPMDITATEDTSGDTRVAESPIAPRKRSRMPVLTDVIDVDGLSSDDEIIVLEVRPSKVFLDAYPIASACIDIILEGRKEGSNQSV